MSEGLFNKLLEHKVSDEPCETSLPSGRSFHCLMHSIM